MKKILWSLSVVLVMLIATGASADIRIDKSNTYSNDLNISSALDSYSECLTNISLLDKDVNLPYNVLVAGGPHGKAMTNPPAGQNNNGAGPFYGSNRQKRGR